MRKFFSIAVGCVVALVGFAGAANASATVDLIWIDMTDTACTQAARRDCPQLGTTLSSAAATSNITLAVIVTAGANDLLGALVSVDYSEVLPEISVVSFRRFNTKPYLPTSLGATVDVPPFIDNINAIAVPFLSLGIGLPAGKTAYLGTVTFHKDALVSGTLGIHVGVDGPGMTDAILDFFGNDISDTTTFNSALLTDGLPSPIPTPTPVPTATPAPIQPTTGSVVGWGHDGNDQATPPAAVNGVSGTATDIAAGDAHSCAIQAGTGYVVCWGAHSQGQTTPPDAVNGVSGTAADITAGDNHSCAIQAGTGNVVCWGLDFLGQTTPPDAVNGVSGTATDIATGGAHSCAIQAGTDIVVCWGGNDDGQSTPPEAVNGVSGTATDIAAGGSVFEVGHSCAIQAATGNVVCWGGNDDGQTTPPDAVNGVSGTATDIAAGGFHSCAIQTGTGNVICWGFNSAGQATPPDAVNGVSGTASDIAAGRFHSCAIQAATGNVVCWGANGFGRATPPDAVNGVSGTATAIAAGDLHSLAIVELPSDCICRVDNVNPNQVVLKNVATGGTFSSKTKKMILIVHAEDAPGASCDAGEVSNPTSINLTMEDDDCGGPPENCGSTGDILIDSRKTIVCEPGKTTNVMRDVFVEGPLHCESSAVPSPTFSNGDVTATVSIAGQPDFVEVLNVKCFP